MEGHFDYFSRRAIEESKAADRAPLAQTAAIHRTLAELYRKKAERDPRQDTAGSAD